jgi:hypothetical protein
MELQYDESQKDLSMGVDQISILSKSLSLEEKNSAKIVLKYVMMKPHNYRRYAMVMSCLEDILAISQNAPALFKQETASYFQVHWAKIGTTDAEKNVLKFDVRDDRETLAKYCQYQLKISS